MSGWKWAIQPLLAVERTVERVPGRWPLSSPCRRRRWPEGQALQGPSAPGYNRHRRTDGLRFKTTRSRQASRRALHHPFEIQKSPENDCVRAYVLFLDSNPVSYLYCRVKNKIVSYDYHGYDPAYAKLSPGTVLQLLALEDLFAEQRFTTFDFTEGEGPHKERFSTGHRLCGDVYVIRRRIRPLSVVMFHHAVNTTSASTGILLNQVKLKSPLKHLLRGTWAILYLTNMATIDQVSIDVSCPLLMYVNFGA